MQILLKYSLKSAWPELAKPLENLLLREISFLEAKVKVWGLHVVGGRQKVTLQLRNIRFCWYSPLFLRLLFLSWILHFLMGQLDWAPTPLWVCWTESLLWEDQASSVPATKWFTFHKHHCGISCTDRRTNSANRINQQNLVQLLFINWRPSFGAVQQCYNACETEDYLFTFWFCYFQNGIGCQKPEL